MVITMLKFEEIREQFLGQICEVLVSISIGGKFVSSGSCLSMVLNVKQAPDQYCNEKNDLVAIFTLLHYYRETHILGKHYLTSDMLRVVS